MHPDTLCFIAARGGSKRFQRKNLALLSGRPVLEYVLDAANESGVFSRVVVSSDDAEILSFAAQKGATIDRRPEHLATDTASVAATLHEFIIRDEGSESNIACIYPTAVLLQASDIIRARQTFSGHPEAATMLAVSGFNLHPWQALYADASGFLLPFFPEIYLKRSQEFPSLCADTGTIYFVRRSIFREHPNFYHPPLVPFSIPELSFVDINFPEDLEKASQLLAIRESRR